MVDQPVTRADFDGLDATIKALWDQMAAQMAAGGVNHNNGVDS